MAHIEQGLSLSKQLGLMRPPSLVAPTLTLAY